MASGGAKAGGQAVFNTRYYFHESGGARVGGAESFALGFHLVEPGGAVAGGSSSFVYTPPAGPGPTCDTALVLTLGVPFNWNTSTVDAQWYKCSVSAGPRGAQYSFNLIPPVSVNVNGTCWEGPDCAHLTFDYYINSINNEQDTIILADTNLYIHIASDLAGPTAYTVEFKFIRWL